MTLLAASPDKYVTNAIKVSNNDNSHFTGATGRGSMVRMSVFGWQTFPDLRLICG